MTLEEKKAFLFFVTGSDRAPIKGLGDLGLLIQRQSPDTDNLPTAHTCTNVFLLPEYSSKNKLKQKLTLALKNNHGFGLI
jgi:ubiquitin-protein ligase E3 A